MGEPAGGEAPLEVDALGLLCPLPLLRARRAAARLSAGRRLVLWSDDEAIVKDLPAWCEGQGHELIGLEAALRGGRPAWRGEIRLGGG